MTNPHLGSSFDDFLEDEGIHDEATAYAVKRVLAWQIEQAMAAQGLSKSATARRMKTSRTQLDPTNTAVQPDTIQHADAAVGRKLWLELV